ncbi:MAG: metal ABC transporter permease [Clostridia bacterium]|nr:metal ABC transporter permease [Clostridia bacterium]
MVKCNKEKVEGEKVSFYEFLFDWTNYTFMRNAFLAILLITPVFGLLGSMIVNNKMSFFSDALGHSALTGAGIGVILGISNISISMILFSVIFAVGIVYIKHIGKSSMDTTIGVFSSVAVALGLVLLSGEGYNKYSSLIIGDILSITEKETVMLFLLLLAVLLVWFVLCRQLILVSLSKSIATSRGVNVVFVDTVFTALIALVVTVSIKWVGLLIINSLFVLPAACSRMISKNMKQYISLSVVISVLCGIFGLFTAFHLGTPAGATVALYCGVLYFVFFIFKRR